MREKQIKGMSLDEITELCISNGFTAFRAKQIFHWIYRHGILNVQEMNNIPDKIKKFINDNFIINTLEINKIQESKLEDTKKFLFETNDNLLIESVSMVDKNLHTVCISSQVGCNVDCKFCATGMMGLKRNLSCGEILDQIIQIQNLRNKPITNIVYMGMGEPFLNYREVIKSAEIIHSPNGMNIGRKKITISTSGIVPKIKRFIDENQPYKLAISLNATTDEIRTRIIPINAKWNIEMILNEIEKFPTNKKNMVMLEYVLLAGINDTKEDAERLSKFANRVGCKVNVIPFNEIGNQYKRPDEKIINQFLEILYHNQRNYKTLVRWSKGLDIDAACGQLSTNNL